MSIRNSLVVLGFAALAAPLAAHADAPLGEYFEPFTEEAPVEPTAEQIGRDEHRNYVEDVWFIEQPAAVANVEKTRNEVRSEISAAPLPVVGA